MEKDRADIAKFLAFVQSLLDEVVNHRPDIIPRGELYNFFEMAWPPVLAAITDAIKQLTSEGLDEPLERVGLTGASLRLKLAGVANAHLRWRQGGKRPGRALRKLLDWIDTLLDSLASVVLAVEIVKEYKDCLRNEADG